MESFIEGKLQTVKNDLLIQAHKDQKKSEGKMYREKATKSASSSTRISESTSRPFHEATMWYGLKMAR